VAAIEATIGGCLEETGYSLSLPEAERKPGVSDKARRAMYRSFLSAKTWLKLNTAAGRLVDLSALEIEDAASAETP
jgi:hypothetical protein